jgi:hypothetical protein
LRSKKRTAAFEPKRSSRNRRCARIICGAPPGVGSDGLVKSPRAIRKPAASTSSASCGSARVAGPDSGLARRRARRTPIDGTGSRVGTTRAGRSRRGSRRACRSSNTRRCRGAPSRCAGRVRRASRPGKPDQERRRLGRADVPAGEHGRHAADETSSARSGSPSASRRARPPSTRYRAAPVSARARRTARCRARRTRRAQPHPAERAARDDVGRQRVEPRGPARGAVRAGRPALQSRAPPPPRRAMAPKAAIAAEPPEECRIRVKAQPRR